MIRTLSTAFLALITTSIAAANEVPTLAAWANGRITVQLRSDADANQLFKALKVSPETGDSYAGKRYVDTGENGNGLEISCAANASEARCEISWRAPRNPRPSAVGTAWSMRLWGEDSAPLSAALKFADTSYPGGVRIQRFQTEDRMFEIECSEWRTEPGVESRSCLLIAYQRRF